MKTLAAALVLLPALAWAAPLPPAVQKLQQAVARATAAHQQARQDLLAETARQQTASRRLTRVTAALIQAARQPAGLTTAYALGHGQVSAPGLLAAAQRQQHSQLHALRQRLAALLNRHQQASRRLAELTELETTFTEATGRLSRLEAQALAAAALEADALAAVLARPVTEEVTQAPAQPAGGATRWPVAGRLVSGWQQAGAERPEGLTFRASPGARVSSVGNGTVLYSGPFRGFNGLVIVEPAPGMYLVYANLADLTVSAGESVSVGQTLGHLPEAGPSTLYFEVRRNGRAVDPQPVLTGTS